jgi:hypothetical protein
MLKEMFVYSEIIRKFALGRDLPVPTRRKDVRALLGYKLKILV